MVAVFVHRCDIAVALEHKGRRIELLAGREQVAKVQRAAFFGQDHRALYHVLQFTHIAGPVVAEQGINGTFPKSGDVLAVAFGHALHEPVHHQRNVVPALTQWRHQNGKHVQPEIEVFPEAAGLDRFAQVDVGRRDDPHINPAHARVAHPLDFALLQRPQQLALGREAQGAYLVQKQRALVGALKAARSGLRGAGVAAALDAKQFGLHQMLGDGRAVDGHKGFLGTPTQAVQVLGEHLLAHAAFTQKQHRGLGGCHLVDHVAHGIEAGRDPHHAEAVFGRCGQPRGNAAGGRQCVWQGGRPFDEVAYLQEAQVVVGIRPVLDRLAHHAAFGVAHAAAFDLAPQNGPAHEGAGVAAGIADQHPAHRFVAYAVAGNMGLGLGAVDQVEIAKVESAFDINIQRHRIAANDAFQRNQLRPGQKVVIGVRAGAYLARHRRVARAGLVANAGDQSACRLLAQALYQFLAQCAQRADVHQHHALVIQPDAPLLRGKAQALGQIVDGRNPDHRCFLQLVGWRWAAVNRGATRVKGHGEER